MAVFTEDWANIFNWLLKLLIFNAGLCLLAFATFTFGLVGFILSMTGILGCLYLLYHEHHPDFDDKVGLERRLSAREWMIRRWKKNVEDQSS